MCLTDPISGNNKELINCQATDQILSHSVIKVVSEKSVIKIFVRQTDRLTR